LSCFLRNAHDFDEFNTDTGSFKLTSTPAEEEADLLGGEWTSPF
jgi:hypothetical protein